MSIIRLQILTSRSLRSSRLLSTVTQQEEEYTAVPHYPPILDTSYEKKLERKKQAEHDMIKDVKTVEEKQIKLNMPKYYGFKCYMFIEDKVPYNNLGLAQHVTKTHLVESEKLPEKFGEIDVDAKVGEMKGEVEDGILMEYEGFRRLHDLNKTDISRKDLENLLAASVTKTLNRTITNNLVQDYTHLLDTQVDYSPRIESFWFAGGMDPPLNVRRYREGVEWRKHTVDDPTDRAIQYFGKPILQLRNELPLRPILKHEEAADEKFTVPYFKYDPRTVGTVTDYKHAANVPGFWPGDPHSFSLLSYLNRGHHHERNYNDPTDSKEALHRQAILSSFASLNAQASFLGFTTFNEITYPLFTQNVITDGQSFSIYLYQLNTLLMHGKNIKENPLKNICWVLPEMKLFEEVKDGKVVGFNEDVLKTLVKLYANVPEERLGLNLRPYLGEEKVIANYEDEEKRAWLEREYKFLVSNRPRFKLDYEVYHWEKIYKIDHKTRSMERRRRPFELFVKPWDRRLDERQAFYVPRKLRPDLPKHKGRYAKEYFP